MVVRRSEMPSGPGGVRPFPRPVRGFAGRRAELDRILRHLDDEVVFLVYGVGGIGKTELVYRAMAEVRERDAWREAVPVHLELREGESTTRALAELLAAIGAPPEPRSGQPTEVAHLTEQLGLLAGLLDERPYLIFLDDVHHLPPEPVAEALAHFSRHVRRSRIFVASRREIRLRPDGSPPLVTTLGPLDPDAATRMMDVLAERLQVARPEPSSLMRSTHGSPFHIRRLLVGGAGDDSLGRSLDELSPLARRLLAVVSVAPHRPLVSAARALFGEGTDDAVAELERRFLIDVESARLVAHDLVREARMSRATDEERRHARLDAATLCGAEVEAGGSVLHAVDAITLALAAGEPEEAWRRVEGGHSKLAAAGSDHLLLAPLEQLREALPDRRVSIDLLLARCLVRASLVERASEALARVGQTRTPLEQTRFFALSGEIAQRRGDLVAAEADFARAVASAPDASTRFHARLQSAIVASYGGEGERARAMVDAALDELAPPSVAQRARGRWARTLTWLFEERFEEALAECVRARDELVLTGLVDLRNQVAMLETLAAVGAEDMERARVAVRRIEVAGLRRRVISLYQAIVRHADGEPRAASAELLEAHDDLRREGDTINAYLAGHFGGAALAESGRLLDGLGLAQRATEDARAAGLRSFVTRSLAQRALLAAESMQTTLAHELADRALASAFLGPRARANAHRAHAHAFTIEGDVVKAREHLDDARRTLEGLRGAETLDVEHAAADLVGGELDAAIGRAEAATRVLVARGREVTPTGRAYDAARALGSRRGLRRAGTADRSGARGVDVAASARAGEPRRASRDRGRHRGGRGGPRAPYSPRARAGRRARRRAPRARSRALDRLLERASCRDRRRRIGRRAGRGGVARPPRSGRRGRLLPRRSSRSSRGHTSRRRAGALASRALGGRARGSHRRATRRGRDSRARVAVRVALGAGEGAWCAGGRGHALHAGLAGGRVPPAPASQHALRGDQPTTEEPAGSVAGSRGRRTKRGRVAHRRRRRRVRGRLDAGSDELSSHGRRETRAVATSAHVRNACCDRRADERRREEVEAGAKLCVSDRASRSVAPKDEVRRACARAGTPIP
ncbi:MAG: AAA family ATPase [Sandaracinus sp.]|nr:AAA family ATPase [Sandaracinus sp.]MCB9621276.1 AAA family ATPase [Sandaracinus sp.]